MTLQPSLFAAVPTPAAAPDDAAWLAQVRADAGRWWASTDRQRIAHTAPLLIGLPSWGHWTIKTHGMEQVGGTWVSRDHARLWLWMALGLCAWHLVPDVATARAAWGDALDAAEARLRRVLGVTS